MLGIKYLVQFLLCPMRNRKWIMTLDIKSINNWNETVSEIGLIQWGRVRHIYVSKLTIIGSDNSLSPDQRQAIIWTNAGILLSGPRTNIIEIRIEIQILKKMHLKMSSGKWLPFYIGINVLTSPQQKNKKTKQNNNKINNKKQQQKTSNVNSQTYFAPRIFDG